MKKINKRLFGAMFTTLLMGLTACNGVKNVDPQSDNDDELILKQPSIAVRKLSSGTNSNSNPYVTFGYTITPSNASDRSIITTLSWLSYTGIEDTAYYDSHINDYLTVSVSEENSTITLTCLQAFTNQANLNITCAANSQCTADVPIDYEIRLDQFNLSLAHLDATSSYTENGQTHQPWWSGAFTTLDTSNSSQWYLQSSEFTNYQSYNASARAFTFPFNSYKSAAAVYSYGTVDNQHETLSVECTFRNVTVASYVSISASLKNKLEQYFESDILPNSIEYGYMTIADFSRSASAWAAANLNAAESSELHNQNPTLNYILTVTFRGSNGVSASQDISILHRFDGRFWDIPVSSFALENGVEVVF